MKLKINIEIDDAEILNLLNKIKDSQVKEQKEGFVVKEMSDYGRFFDEYNPNFVMKELNKNFNEANSEFILSVEALMNIILKQRGYLFLSEVYEHLGIPPSRQSRIVGWMYNENNPIGDNCVNISIVNHDLETGKMQLDFNVDGFILDKIKD